MEQSSFSVIYHILIPISVTFVTYISLHFILRKSRMKEILKVNKTVNQVGVLEVLIRQLEKMKECVPLYTRFMITHIENRENINFVNHIARGKNIYNITLEQCKLNELRIDENIRDRVEGLLTSFKDKIVFKMEDMKDIKLKSEDFRLKTIDEIKKNQKEVEKDIDETIEELKKRAKSV